MKNRPSIIEAIKDENLLRNFLDKGKGLRSYYNWFTCLRAIYGQPITSKRGRDLVRECTGRDPDSLSPDGYQQSLLICGRKSGKSQCSSLIGAFESVLAGNESKCARGEMPATLVISPTRAQSRIIHTYMKEIFTFPMFAREVVSSTKSSFLLRSGITVEIGSGLAAYSRGYSVICALLDEIAHIGVSDEANARVKNDQDLVAAIEPSLLVTQGRMISLTTPYSPRGYVYNTWKRDWGNNDGATLVWRAPSTLMNPLLSEAFIKRKLEEDPSRNRAEYLAEWREDVEIWLPRSVIEKAVVPGQGDSFPMPGEKYNGFTDMSGGRRDDAALAISFRDEGKVRFAFIKRWRPPFSPYEIIQQQADILKRYRCNRVTGDRYSAEFTASAFRAYGIAYQPSVKNKSELYGELLPMLCSNSVALPDNDVLISQLAGLERRTRSGREIIDHPSSAGAAKDDLANAVAGAAFMSAGKRSYAGAAGF